MKKRVFAFIMAFALAMSLMSAAVFADESSEDTSYPELTVESSISGTSGSAGEAYYFSFISSEDFVYLFEVSVSDYSGSYEIEIESSNWTTVITGSTEDDDTSFALGGEGNFVAGEYTGCIMFEDSANVSFTISVSYYDSGSLGDNITWSIDRETGVLTVSGSGDIEDCDDSPWYYNGLCYFITAIVIEDGITSIGEEAFAFLEKVTSVTLPESLTEIAAFGLYDLASLTSIDLSNVVYIGGSALQSCGLTSVILSDELTYIGDYAFANTDLTSITIPASVEEIGYSAFSYCTSLTEITVEEGNEYYVVSDGVLFNYDMTILICYPAGKEGSEYTIPDGVVEIGDGAFSCSSLTTINFADSVVTIGMDAFYRCIFTEIIIGKNVETIGYWAFESCYYLESVYIPLSVTEICGYAFFLWGDCSGVTYYYQGSEEQWNEIEIGELTCIDEGTIVYNCEDVWSDSDSDSDSDEDSTAYSIIEAETSASYTLGSGEAAVIAIDADIAEFVSVAVEGTVLTQDTDYTVTEGSTIITFTESYLESLEPGTYDVVITFTNGTASATLTILDPSSSSDSDTPEVGDDSDLALWMCLAAVAALSLGIMGLRKKFD